MACLILFPSVQTKQVPVFAWKAYRSIAFNRLPEFMKGGYISKSRDTKGCLDLDYLTSTLYPRIPGAVVRDPHKPASASPSKAAKKTESQDNADPAGTSEQIAQATPSDAPLSPLLAGLDAPPAAAPMEVDSLNESQQPNGEAPQSPLNPVAAGESTSAAAAAAIEGPQSPLDPSAAGESASSAAAAANQAKSAQPAGDDEAKISEDAVHGAAASKAGAKHHATQETGRKRSAAAAEMGVGASSAALPASTDKPGASGPATANGHAVLGETASNELGHSVTEVSTEVRPEAAVKEAVHGNGMPPTVDAGDKMLTEGDSTDGAPIEPDPNSIGVPE